MTFQTILIITIAVYFSFLMLVSRLAGRSDNDAFFRGNRQSPWYLVAFGMVGASLSGVTFISVPGWAATTDMTYMQMCIGFFFGYLIVAYLLLPLYYRNNLTSIYTYLGRRFGNFSYKTGSIFFLVSKLTGAAARLYLVCLILQQFVFDSLHVPYPVTVLATLLLIWLYTRRSGIKAIVWTDAVQTLCLLLALCLILWQVVVALDYSPSEALAAVVSSPHSRMFEFTDWASRQNFWKQFLSGVFIVIVMTGLDQDMMQKNLTCKSLRDAQKDMSLYGVLFAPVNLLFLALGVLVIILYGKMGIDLPQQADSILPDLIQGGTLGNLASVFFAVGIISSAFSSADSALTALTTTFCIDILEVEKSEGRFSSHPERTRKFVHVAMISVFVLFILAFKVINNNSVIDAIYTIASYTYGPLLGLFAFGMFTKRQPRDRFVPFVAVLSPLLCYVLSEVVSSATGYTFAYELLLLNGLLTMAGLFLLSRSNKVES